MEKEFIDKYSPFNAKNLSKEDLDAMAGFSKEQIKALADAYPNKASQVAYLVLKDKSKPDKGQVFPLNTWKGLSALHRLGNTNFIAISFKSIFNRKESNLKVAPVQDLTNKQAKEELKSATTQTATADNGTPGGSIGKSAEQVAKEEGDGLDKKVTLDKPLEKMNKAELTAKYYEIFGEDPEEGSTNAQLKAAIQAKL